MKIIKRPSVIICFCLVSIGVILMCKSPKPIEIYYNSCEDTSLINAVGNGNIEEVEHLIKNGADVNCIGNVTGDFNRIINDTYILYHTSYATGSRRPTFVYEELRRYELRRIEGTALIEAVSIGSPEIVKLLLEARADANVKIKFYAYDGNHGDGPGGPFPTLSLSEELSVLKWALSGKKYIHNKMIEMAKDKKVSTAVLTARQQKEKNMDEIIKLLKSYGAKK